MAAVLNRDSTAFALAIKTLVDMGENVGEEKLEQILGKFDLRYLLSEKSITGTMARVVNAIPADGLLVGLNLLASYIDMRPDFDPAAKFIAITFLRALPQAIPVMFGGVSPKVEDAQKKLEAHREEILRQTKQRKAYVGPKRTDLVHLTDIHPHGKDDVVNEGDLLQVLRRFSHNPLCPDCFNEELATGRIRVEVVTPKKKGRGFGAIAHFKNPEKQRFFDAIEMLAAREVQEDHGLGLPPDASHIQAAHAYGLEHDPEGLEDLIPVDPDAAARMFELAAMDRAEIEEEKETLGTKILLPLSARRYVRRLVAAYRVDHQPSHAQVRARDWGDTIIDWVPADLKPKKKGWAGVKEVSESPIGAIFLTLLGIFALLVLFAGVAIVGPLLMVALYAVWHIASGVSAVLELVDPYLSDLLLGYERSVATVWFSAVILGIATWFDPSLALWRLRTWWDPELHLEKPVEFLRPKLLTIRLGADAFGLAGTIIGWGVGHISNFGVAAFLTAVWFVFLTVDATIKWEKILPENFRVESLMKTIKGFGGGVLVAATLAVLFFTAFGPEDADRATALSAGVVNNGADQVAAANGVSLPMAEAQCRAAVESLQISAAGAGMTVQEICALSPSPVCACLK